MFGLSAQRVIPEPITTERAISSKKKNNSTLLFENKRRKSELTQALTLSSMMCDTNPYSKISEKVTLVWGFVTLCLMKRLGREALTHMMLFVIMNGDVSV